MLEYASDEQRRNAQAMNDHQRGISSAGRAPALQAGGRRFDPVILHQMSISKHPSGCFDIDILINNESKDSRLFFKNS